MAQINIQEPVQLSMTLQTCDCIANATETVEAENLARELDK